MKVIKSLCFGFLIAICCICFGCAETEKKTPTNTHVVEPTPELTPNPTPEPTPNPTPEPIIDPIVDWVNEYYFLMDELVYNVNGEFNFEEIVFMRNEIIKVINAIEDGKVKETVSVNFNNYDKYLTYLLVSNYMSSVNEKLIIDEELGFEIMNAYYNLDNEDMNYPFDERYCYYLGSYNDNLSHAVLIQDFDFAVLSGETIENIDFHYNNSNEIKIYYKNKFFSLQDAYDDGIITYIDLIKINCYHRYYYGFLYNDREYSEIKLVINNNGATSVISYYVNLSNIIFSMTSDDVKKFIVSNKDYLNISFDNINIYVNKELSKPLNQETYEYYSKLYVVIGETKYYNVNEIGIYFNKIKNVKVNDNNLFYEYEHNILDVLKIYNLINLAYRECKLDEIIDTSPSVRPLVVTESNNFIRIEMNDGNVFGFVLIDGHIQIITSDKQYISNYLGIESFNIYEFSDLFDVININYVNYGYAPWPSESNTLCDDKAKSYMFNINDAFIKVKTLDDAYKMIIKNDDILHYGYRKFRMSGNYSVIASLECYYSDDYSNQYSILKYNGEYYVNLYNDIDDIQVLNYDELHNCRNDVEYTLSDIPIISRGKIESDVVIISSTSELENYLEKYNEMLFIFKDGKMDYSLENYKAKYNDDFFKDKSLILLVDDLLNLTNLCYISLEGSTLVLNTHKWIELQNDISNINGEYLTDSRRLSTSNITGDGNFIIPILPGGEVIKLELYGIRTIEVYKDSIERVEEVIIRKS